MKFSSLFFFLVVHLSLSFLTSSGTPLGNTERQPLSIGDHPGLQRVVLQRIRRARADKLPKPCSVKDFQANVAQCCSSCPAGYHQSSTEGCTSGFHCSSCSRDTFTDRENKLMKCIRCAICDEGVSHVVVQTCTNMSDTKCGCADGYVQKSRSDKSFDCLKTPTTTLMSTSPALITKKGSVEERPVDQQTLSMFLLFLAVMAILVGLSVTPALCHLAGPGGYLCPWGVAKKFSPAYSTVKMPLRRLTSDSPGEPCEAQNPGLLGERSHVVVAQSEGLDDSCAQMEVGVSTPFNVSSKQLDPNDLQPTPLRMLEQESLSESWPASVLYAIIQEVPVRRWKEFLRLLRVPDGQMERAQMEAGPSYLEQQYQMLRQWSRRGGAGLPDVYAALESMDLSGCADELRDRLQRLGQQTHTAQAETDDRAD